MSKHRVGATCLAFLIICSSCASPTRTETAADAVAEEILNRIEKEPLVGVASIADGAGSASTQGGTSCRIEEVEDEYGQPIDVEVCDRPAGSPDDGGGAPLVEISRSTGLPSLVAADVWYGGDDATSLVDAMVPVLLVPCSEEPGAMPELIGAPRAISEGLVQLYASARDAFESCGDLAAFESAQSEVVGNAIALVDAMFGESPSVPDQAGGALLVASSVVAFEWLAWGFKAAENIFTHQSPLWWSFAQRGHTSVLVTTTADVVAVGTSQTQYSIKPDDFDGLSVFNAGIPGGSPSVSIPWLSRVVLPRTGARQVILGLSGIDYVTAAPGACRGGRGNAFNNALDLGESLYKDSPLSAQPILELFEITELADVLADTPLERTDRRVYGENGDFQSYPRLNQAQRDNRNGVRSSIFQTWVECPERVGFAETVVRESTLAGLEVTVVFMPLDEGLRVIAPLNGERLVELNAEVAKVLTDAGARTVDLTTRLESSQMVDFIHVDAEGARIVTADVKAALS